jgi:3(or 17)beta-hydroxysteroid dehydrogenase
VKPQLEGKVAIVTGGAKGLGAAVVRLFVAEGATVVISDVDLDAGMRLAREIGPRARFEPHDVSSESEWVRVIADTVARFGHLDVLVNNAAVLEIGSIETASLEQWRFVNGVIADGTFFGCKHAVRAMKENGGTIVNVSSVASLQGEPYNIAYTAAKGAVAAMTRSIAVHCVQMRYPIRCNSLHPGPIRTPMVAEMPAKLQQAVEQGFVMPPGFAAITSHSAAPDEIAPSVLFLASPASQWVNGTQLVVDHTQSITRGSVPLAATPHRTT